MDNKRKMVGEGECVRVLVEGLGPARLLAVWLAFEQGFCVVGVNRALRRKDYRRTKRVVLNTWTEQLRWFWGTRFSELFKPIVDDRYLADMNDVRHTLEMDIYMLEEMMQARLEELYKYLEGKSRTRDAKKLMELVTGHRMVEVKFPRRNGEICMRL